MLFVTGGCHHELGREATLQKVGGLQSTTRSSYGSSDQVLSFLLPSLQPDNSALTVRAARIVIVRLRLAPQTCLPPKLEGEPSALSTNGITLQRGYKFRAHLF